MLNLFLEVSLAHIPRKRVTSPIVHFYEWNSIGSPKPQKIANTYIAVRTDLFPERGSPLNLCRSLALASSTAPGSLSFSVTLGLLLLLKFSVLALLLATNWLVLRSDRTDARSLAREQNTKISGDLKLWISRHRHMTIHFQINFASQRFNFSRFGIQKENGVASSSTSLSLIQLYGLNQHSEKTKQYQARSHIKRHKHMYRFTKIERSLSCSNQQSRTNPSSIYKIDIRFQNQVEKGKKRYRERT